MSRVLFLFLLTPALAFGAGEIPGPKGEKDKGILFPPSPLDRRLRDLEREIAAVRGLEFKSPVKAQVIPRGDADPKKQGFYDPLTKTLFLYEDIKGTYEKGVLVHEMVHALQDQHFDLIKMGHKLHEAKEGEDAALALEALIEGDATFTMIEMLKKEQPKIAAMLEAPLEKAGMPRNAFVYAQGARYIKAIHGRGGWKAVNGLYRFPPRQTATIFNLKSVSSIDLGPGPVMGAYGLWKKLHGAVDSREAAVKIAKAWRGDRVLEIPAGKAFLFHLADAEHAKLLADTFNSLPGKGPDAFFDFRHQTVQDGNRVWFLTGVGDRALGQLRERVFGPLRLQVWNAKGERLMSYGDFIEDMLAHDMICIGELHNQELHHRVQLQILKSIHARDERLGVGLEMFQLPFQKVIDRFWKGEIVEEGFLKETEYQSRWGYDWSLYRPIIEFSRKNGIPVAALNVPREITFKISKGGWDSLEEADRKLLGPVDFGMKEHREWWYERLAKLHGDDKAPVERKERGYQVMTAWDDVMGRTAAEFQKAKGLRRMVVLAGIGHVEHGFGIPLRAARVHGARVATVGIMINPPKVPFEGTGRVFLEDRPMTDYVILVREE